MKDILKKIIKLVTGDKIVFLPKDKLSYAKDLLFTYNNANFLTDPNFQKAYSHVKRLDTTGITGEGIEWRIHVLCWAATHASKLDGDFVDCGVNTGLFSRAVMEYIQFEKLNKTYYLLDTFEGMDPRYSNDYEMARHSKIGYQSNIGLYEQAQQTFANFNAKIIKGAVPDTLNEVTTNKVAYLSIDMNCVLPEVAALDFFWNKMVSGGIIVLDDYAYPGAEDQRIAHDKFAESKGVKILCLPTCQGIIIKP